MATDGRERWGGRGAFIMAAVGSAVGLGNLWRFPAVAFTHGGGAFFIPYFVALISAGIPLMIVEYALGQKFQGGAPKALAAVTSHFRWVGWFALLVSTTITMYYVVVMAYAWHYAAASFTVAWQKPAPVVQVEGEGDQAHAVQVPASRVALYVPAQDEAQKLREQKVQDRRPAERRLPVLTPDEVAARQAAEAGKPEQERLHYVGASENAGNYFMQVCLGGYREALWRHQKALGDPDGRDARLTDMFRLSPNLVIGALITWIAIFLIIFRGVRNVGKVVMVTVPLPVILLLIVLIRGITLPGAVTGIIYYLKPNWALLKDPAVWIAAYGQIFFSLSLGFGILIAYASYMPPESDVTNSAFITSLGNCATSFFAGLAVFSVLGYLAYMQGQEVSEVVKGGPGLVFITYPVALAKMPMGHWGVAGISFLFFLCLISLGIDSAFSLVEGVVTGFRDRSRRLPRATLTAVVCTVGFCGSLFFCTRSGLMWLDIVDRWMNQYGLAMVGLLECIAVAYFFNLDDLKEYINRHSEIKVHNWFDAFIKVVTPAILIFLLANQFLQDITETYGGYDQVLRFSVTLAGWGWFALILCGSMVLSRHYRAVAGVFAALGVFAVLWVYMKLASGQGWGDLAAPAAVGAVAATVLFGGLAACIRIAVKTHHMAGLSLEARSDADEPGDEA